MANVGEGVDPTGLIAGARLLELPAEEFVNHEDVELLWAMKASEHMEVHFNLLKALDPKSLRLTPVDQNIFDDFISTFGNKNINLGKLNESELKSEESKAVWREFCNRYENVVEDFNFGTILRLDSMGDYSPENTIFVPRVQFYAIEIARNKSGLNDGIREKFGKNF